jgi:hypothetical protein
MSFCETASPFRRCASIRRSTASPTIGISSISAAVPWAVLPGLEVTDLGPVGLPLTPGPILQRGEGKTGKGFFHRVFGVGVPVVAGVAEEDIY